MTGCDLRYEAEQIVVRLREAMSDERAEALTLAQDVETLVSALSPLATLAESVAGFVARLRGIADKNRETTGTLSQQTFDTIEKVRAHFHEAVDARVEQENEDREEDHSDCYNEDQLSEARDEAAGEAKQEVIDAIRRALDRLE